MPQRRPVTNRVFSPPRRRPSPSCAIVPPVTETDSGMRPPQIHPDLDAAVMSVLERHPAGIGEYELLQELKRLGLLLFGNLRDRLSMFQMHFILFHVLYRMRARRIAQGEGDLEVSGLCVRLLGPDETNPSAGTADRMAEYYGDLSNLEETTGSEVQSMLDTFWAQARTEKQDGTRRREALSVLGLTEPADEQSVKRRYEELIESHDPKRGGDVGTYQAIQAAMMALRDEVL